jgi:hypothetical protein
MRPEPTLKPDVRRGDHAESLRRRRGVTAGAKLGTSLVDR